MRRTCVLAWGAVAAVVLACREEAAATIVPPSVPAAAPAAPTPNPTATATATATATPTATATATATPTPNPTPTSTSTPTSTPTSTATPAAPSTPASPPVPLSRAQVVEPAGSSPLSPSAETVVDPASTFQVELGARIVDARLVLLDAADAHVPAKSTHEVGGKTQLALAPAEPLVPGSRYVLRVEGATSRELRDGDRAWAPLSFPVLTAGTPPPPEPKKKPKAKAKKRR